MYSPDGRLVVADPMEDRRTTMEHVWRNVLNIVNPVEVSTIFLKKFPTQKQQVDLNIYSNTQAPRTR